MLSHKTALFDDHKWQRSARRLSVSPAELLIVVICVVAVDVSGQFLRGPSLVRFILPAGLFILQIVGSHYSRSLLVNKPMVAEVCLVILVGFGFMLASLWQIAGYNDTGVTFILTIGIGLVSLLTPPETFGQWKAVRFVRMVATVATVITIEGALSQNGFNIVPQQLVTFKQEQAAIYAVAIVASYLTRRWLLLGLASVALVATYTAYPAFTTILAVVAAIVTMLAITLRLQRSVIVLAIAGLVLGPVSIFVTSPLKDDPLSELSSSYYNASGKFDSTDMRADLAQEAIRRIRLSPIVGDAFSSNGEVERPNLDGYSDFGFEDMLPPHNDYLELWMRGGIIAVILFVGWAIGCNAIGIRCTSSTLCPIEYRTAISVALSGLNSSLAVSLINPLLVKTSLTCFTMLCGAVVLSCSRSARRSAIGDKVSDSAIV